MHICVSKLTIIGIKLYVAAGIYPITQNDDRSSMLVINDYLFIVKH